MTLLPDTAHVQPGALSAADDVYSVEDDAYGRIALRPARARKGWACAVTGAPILPGAPCLVPRPRHRNVPLRVSLEGWAQLAGEPVSV